MAAIVAALGVLLVGIGESLLHFTGSLSASGPDSLPFGFFLKISPERLYAGHFITVLTVSAYFLGYWHVSRRLAPVSLVQRRLFFGMSVYSLTLAAIWIGSRAYLARSLQIVEDPELRQMLASEYASLIESLIWGLRIGMLSLGAFFAWLVARGETSFPRWMALANPAFLLAGTISTLFVPSIGIYLVPAALNVAHVPFFLLSAFVPYASRVEGHDPS